MHTHRIRIAILTLTALAAASACSPGQAGAAAANAATDQPASLAPAIQAPKLDIPLAAQSGDATAVFAGGCFWGVEAVFEQLKGVKHAESGYAGGSAMDADYERVSSGDTRHAESVRVVYDPSRISYGQLLRVFFSVAHDPTQLNRQGPDVGPQYRSALFFKDTEQEKVAKAYVAQLDAAGIFGKPIVTELKSLKRFYPAEAHHQDYMRKNPNQPYIVYHDRPKLIALERQFPELVKGAAQATR